jgi:hypothetical protein
MSKVPGDRSDLSGTHQINLEEIKIQSQTSNSQPILEQRISNLSNTTDLQVMISPSTSEINEPYEESKTTDIND